MSSTVLRNLYVIAENKLDVQILRTILDCSGYKVFDYGVKGYHDMANVCRTLRLMINADDRILIAFDTETRNKEAIEDLFSTMVYLTKADVSKVPIGIFPMVPNFYDVFGITKEMRNDLDELINHLKTNSDKLKSKRIISAMQSFLGR